MFFYNNDILKVLRNKSDVMKDDVNQDIQIHKNRQMSVFLPCFLTPNILVARMEIKNTKHCCAWVVK